MPQDQTLFETPFVAIIDRDGYQFLRQTRANSTLVALLPYRNTAAGREYLERLEVCPAHSPETEPASITGGLKPGHTVTQTAVAELREESGYSADEGALVALGTVRPSKQSDTTVHLFAVDVTNSPQGTIEGDGSRYEVGASVRWSTRETVLTNKDPLIITMLARLESR